MAHMPVEAIDIGDIPTTSLSQAISLANSLQNEFFFDRLAETDAAQFRMHSFTRIFAPDFSSPTWRCSVRRSRAITHS
jgi:hypothetical protein